jgi:hypothetical protein
MTIEDDIKQLESLWKKTDHDVEQMHIEADTILLKYVPKDIAAAYRKIDDEHPFWYS